MMNNYEYIISSLPALSLGWKFGNGTSFGSYTGWIRSQLGDADLKKLDRLMDGFKDENLNPDFYKAALSDKDPFISGYFSFDLNVRNGKARFLNKAFERPLNQDTIEIETGEFAEAARLDAVLLDADLLSRERGLDSLMWDKISQLVIFNYFDMDAVLAFVAKLHIIARWSELDEKTGREMFLRLVEEVRSSFKGVEYEAPKEKENYNI